MFHAYLVILAEEMCGLYARVIKHFGSLTAGAVYMFTCSPPSSIIRELSRTA